MDRRSQFLGTIGVVTILVLGAAWLFRRPAPPATFSVTTSPTIATPKMPVASANAPQVAAPTVAPVTPHAESAASVKLASNPQLELNTALSDLLGLVQSGDFVTAADRYVPPDFLAKIPPEQKAQMEQQLTAAMSNPQSQQAIQIMVAILQDMQAQTPTMNAASDRATYQISDPSGRSTKTKPLSMLKIDGKWYIDAEAAENL